MPQGVWVRVPSRILNGRHCVDKDIVSGYYLYMRIDLEEHKQDILMWIDEHRSLPEMCRMLGCARDTLPRYLKKWGIDYKGNQGGKGRKVNATKKSVLQLIKSIESGNDVNNSRLRDRLIEEGLKESKCELCGLEQWLDKPIQLELHHADFNHHNTEMNNLRILCGNCHNYVHKYKILI